MNYEIKKQLGVIINFVVILLIFKGFGILKSAGSSLSFMIDMISIGHSVRTIVYLFTLIVPFIFLVKFFLALQKANRNNELILLKDAFKQLKTYFILLIGSKLLLIALDLVNSAGQILG